MLPSIPPSPPFVPHKYPNVFYIDATNGLDTNDGTFENPFKTLTKANSSTSGSGTLWLISPGTYSDALTINAANLDICGFGARSGLINITGTLTFSATSGSIRCANFSHASLSLTTTRPVYFKDCNISSGSISKTGSGYLYVDSCDWANSTTISLSAGISSLFNTTNSFLTVTGTGTVSVNSSPSCIAPLVSSGYLDIVNSTVYASIAGGNAVASSGQGVLSLSTSRFFQPSGYMAKVAIEGISYSMRDCQYEPTDSSITAAYVGYSPVFGNMKIVSPQAIDALSINTSAVGIDLDGNLVRSPFTAAPIEAFVKRDIAQNYVGGNDNSIAFNIKEYDTHGAYNTTNSTFTCPRSGFLTITVSIQVEQTSTNQLNVWKNGVFYKAICQTNTGSVVHNGTFKTKCLKGDTFTPKIYVAIGKTGPADALSNWASFSIV